MSKLELKQVFNIANVLSESLLVYNEYCKYQQTYPNIPISLHIYDYANVKKNATSIDDYIKSKEAYDKKQLDVNIFYIFITNTRISHRKMPASLRIRPNIKMIIVPPNLEEDDAIALCLAAHYIKDNKDINNLCIFSNDHYNNLQHMYIYKGQILDLSLTDLYNKIMTDNNRLDLIITHANVIKISNNTIQDMEIIQSEIMAREKKFADLEEAHLRTELINRLGQQKKSRYMNKYLKYKNKYLNLKKKISLI